MMTGKIDTYKMRYIVPFSYESDKNFEQICNTLSYNQDWFRDEIRESDQDLYPYMVENLIQSPGSKNNIANAWRYRKTSHAVLQLAWLPGKKRGMRIKISKAGLFLFRSGIGLFWYEAAEINGKAAKLSVDELVQFQNAFKELNRSVNRRVFYKVGKECLAEIEDSMLVDGESIPVEELNRYEKCVYMPGRGERVNKYISKENIKCVKQNAKGSLDEMQDLNEKNLGYNVFLKKDGEQRKLMIKWQDCRAFSMGDWIAKVLRDLKCHIRYYPEKRNCMRPMEGTDRNGKFGNWRWEGEREVHPDYVPDKAILFNYCVFVPEWKGDMELIHGAFHLTNGYKESYLPPENVEKDMLFLSGNTCCYTTKEGCGYYVCRDELNAPFFDGYMKDRIVSNHFFLYIHLLYQSYTLLRYASLINGILSGDVDDYRDEESLFAEQLESIRTDINLFLIKSVNASVSHMDQHNLYYQYSEKRLEVREDIQSITTGLRSLEELLKMRKQRREEKELRETNGKVTYALGLLSLFGIISVYVDSFGLVSMIKDKWVFAYIPDILLYLIPFLVITFCAVCVLKILVSGYYFHGARPR